MTAATIAVVVATILTGTGDVRGVALEPDGAVWAATTGGLLRHAPGEPPTVLTPADGLPDGTVRAVRAEEGHLWVGTDRGLARVSLEDRAVTRVLRTGSAVTALARMDGALYAGTWKDGLLRLEGGRDPIPVADLSRITGLATAGDLLYVTSTSRGAHVFDGTRLHRLGGDQLAWDVAARGDEAWVATSQGVLRLRGGRIAGGAAVRAARRLPLTDVRAIAFDEGTPVIGTFGDGVRRWDGSAWVRVTGTVPADARVRALGAGGGRLAVGTAKGLFHREGNAWTRSDPPILPHNDLTSLARTAEGLWIGTFQHGLVLVRDDGRIETFDEARGLIDDRINRLAVDGDGHLWVATDRGVAERVDGRFRARGLLGEHVFVVGVVGGTVYAGAGGDLWRFDGERFVRIEGFPLGRPQDVAPGPGGAVVVASAEGLAVLGDDGWTVRRGGAAGLPDDWVTAAAHAGGGLVVGTYNAGTARIEDDRITRLHDGLWINAGALAAWRTPQGRHGTAAGTLDGGLWLRSGTARARITTAEGLPDDDVTAVLPDGGGLWVATRGGLARITVAPATNSGSSGGDGAR